MARRFDVMVAMLGLTGGLLGANLLSGQVPPQTTKTMTLENLVIVDDAGTRRAHLGMTDEGVMLLFFDEKGEARLLIGSGLGEPSVRMTDSAGQTRMSAGIMGDASVLFLKNKDGVPVTQLSATGSGGNLHFFNEKLESVWQARQ